MILTEANVLVYLESQDYSKEQAIAALSRYRHTFVNCKQGNALKERVTAEDCGNQIIRKHMEDVDAANGVI